MKLTDFASGGGCGCKLPPHLLRDLLQQADIFQPAPAALLVGAQNADDAAVWRLNDEQAIIATTDFFSPLVDDAHDFGRIAATNALSDVYAMGGTPLFALAITAMPAGALPADTIAQILAGGQAACRDAGVVIAGGHSIDAKEPLYGLAVVGQVHPDKLLTNAGARVGDQLLLGKPLGIGVLSAALRRGRLSAAEYDVMLAHTTQLNRAGSALAEAAGAGIHALTDVTGFGLLGHLAELCRAAKVGAATANRGAPVGAQLRFADLPLLPAAVAHAKNGISTGAAKRNWESVRDLLGEVAPQEEWQRAFLTDPQTSGGLLVACDGAAVAAVREVFAAHGQEATLIGEITDSGALNVSA